MGPVTYRKSLGVRYLQACILRTSGWCKSIEGRRGLHASTTGETARLMKEDWLLRWKPLGRSDWVFSGGLYNSTEGYRSPAQFEDEWLCSQREGCSGDGSQGGENCFTEQWDHLFLPRRDRPDTTKLRSSRAVLAHRLW
jgi:hypothetical protein